MFNRPIKCYIQPAAHGREKARESSASRVIRRIFDGSSVLLCAQMKCLLYFLIHSPIGKRDCLVFLLESFFKIKQIVKAQCGDKTRNVVLRIHQHFLCGLQPALQDISVFGIFNSLPEVSARETIM